MIRVGGVCDAYSSWVYMKPGPAFGVAFCHGGYRFFQTEVEANDCLKEDQHAYFSFSVQHVGKHSPPLLRLAMAASGYGDALTRTNPGVA
jgi:hypothetical protein